MPVSLPVHPLTGARALGWRKARPGEDDGELYPIWPILGAAEDDDPDGEPGDGDPDGGDDGEPDDDGQGDDDPEGADALGEPGKRALAAMKDKLKAEKARRRELEQQLADKDGADEAATARRKAEAAALARANSRILKAEIRAAAKGRLNDPKDALTFLNLDQFEVGEDGDIDTEEIDEAIEDLLKAKPYLAAATAKRFQGSGDGGAARKASRPKQLTRADLKTMTPEAIDKAREEGRLEDLMGGK